MSAYLDESCIQKSYTTYGFLKDNWCYNFEAGDGAVCKQTVNNGIITSYTANELLVRIIILLAKL